jgi:hypothetical protein
MSDSKQIFILGSSRSGTTMMSRILANNPSIFSFRELHFFGTLWTNNSNQKLTKKHQIDLLSRLFCIQKNGLFNQNKNQNLYAKSENLLTDGVKDPLEIYELFLETIAAENSAEIACEHTPKNLYYINEILQFFPNAKVINLVRDQRDVLLSQKNKWKRRSLGAQAIPIFEALRSYLNYHPILTAAVWSSSLTITSKYLNNARVKIIRFEDLIKDSKNEVRGICKFLQIDFKEEMLNVPVIGSSTENDTIKKLKLDSSKVNKWKKGGLSQGEIYLSQKFSSKMMRKFGYKKKEFCIPPFSIFFYFLIFPVKLVLAFIFNVHRMGNIVEVIKKRFFIK